MSEIDGSGRRPPVRGATWGRRKLLAGAAVAAAVATTATAALPAASAIAADRVPAAGSATGPTAPYIVEAAAGKLAAAEHDVAAAGGRVWLELPIINGFSAQLPPAAVSALQADGDVREVTPDTATSTEGARYRPYKDPGSPIGLSQDIGYNRFWAAGYAGQGVGVALLDSGVAPVSALAASGKVIYGPDFTPTGYFPQVRALDTFGHGTFMAGLIAGRDPGATAPYVATASDYLGVAPDAHIVSVKVADESGATMMSAVIAGIGWVVAHRDDPELNIRVLNLSLGVRDGLPYTLDPLDAAAEAAWHAGITVVAAAGNDGLVGLTAPANDPYVIAVAAIDSGASFELHDDGVASFSDLGDGVRNPDFGALGTHIVGLRDPGSAIDEEYGQGDGSVNAELMRGSGTSESAAITSGAAALLISQRPELTPDKVKATLAAQAVKVRHLTERNSGAGELNMARVLDAPTANAVQDWTPSTFSAGWPPVEFDSALPSLTPSGATWTGATWTACNWTGATWTGATWTGATWTGATWTGATWTGATWTDAMWQTQSWK